MDPAKDFIDELQFKLLVSKQKFIFEDDPTREYTKRVEEVERKEIEALVARAGLNQAYKCAVLKDMIAITQSFVSFLRSVEDAHENQIQDLEAQLRTAREEQAALEHPSSQTVGRSDTVVPRDEHKGLEEEVAKLREELEGSEEHTGYRSQVRFLTSSLQKAEDKRAKTRSELNQQNSKVRDLETALKQLQNQGDAKGSGESEQIANLTSELHQCRQEGKQIKLDGDKKQKKINELESAIEQLKVEAGNSKSGSNEKDRAQAEIDELKSEVRGRDEKIGNLQSALKQRENEVNGLKARERLLHSKNAAEIRNLETAIGEHRKKFELAEARHKDEVKRSKRVADELKSAQSETVDLKSEKKRLESTNEQQQQEIENMKVILEVPKSTSDSESVRMLKQQNNLLSRDAARWSGNSKRLEDEYEKMKSTLKLVASNSLNMMKGDPDADDEIMKKVADFGGAASSEIIHVVEMLQIDQIASLLGYIDLYRKCTDTAQAEVDKLHKTVVSLVQIIEDKEEVIKSLKTFARFGR